MFCSVEQWCHRECGCAYMSVLFPIDYSIPVKTKVFKGLGKSSPLSVQFNFYVHSSADREKKYLIFFELP